MSEVDALGKCAVAGFQRSGKKLSPASVTARYDLAVRIEVGGNESHVTKADRGGGSGPERAVAISRTIDCACVVKDREIGYPSLLKSALIIAAGLVMVVPGGEGPIAVAKQNRMVL